MKIIFFKLLIVFIFLFNYSEAQTVWTKDASNPVLRRDTFIANLPNDIFAISDCWVVKEGNIYKMWYTCGGLNYPTDTLLRNRMCYATSTDGVVWVKYSGNPVMDVSYTGGWDSLAIETATVIVDSMAPANEKYKMWYAGQYFNSYRYDLGYAYSPDGISWTKYPNPILQVGNSSEWDNGFIEGPSVIKDGSIYKMWYCGYDAVVDANGTDGHANIGYATSVDGINWTKDPGNPIITTGINSWDSISVQDPHVIKQGNVYYMWYGGNNVGGYGQSVGFATSSDGINWNKSPANPVLPLGNPGDWDANTASFPSVINDNGIYKMWYTGKDVDPLPVGTLDYYWEIGYATAPITGISETNFENSSLIFYPNPVNEILNIELESPVKNASLVVYNSFGQIVIRFSDLNDSKISVDLKDYPSGIYCFVFSSEGNRLVKEFIVDNGK